MITGPDFPQPIAARVITLPTPTTPAELYLDLMKKLLTRALIARPNERHTVRPSRGVTRLIFKGLSAYLQRRRLELVRIRPSSPDDYLESGHSAENRGEDAETMVGTRQLDNIQFCLYPKLSPGGYALFDDYLNLPDCRRAVEDYRREYGVVEEIMQIDQRAVFWRRRG